jgi:Fur family zinc uptake transcriptional regulator
MTARCEHADARGAGLDGPRLARAVGAALTRCAEAGERMTAPRRRVLERLLAADAPVKAYDLVGADDGAAAKPPTVYRALAFLERMGFAHRIESLNAYVACRLGADRHAAAFLICDCCGATREIAPAGVERFAEAAAAGGYAVETLTIEAHGRCGACAGA